MISGIGINPFHAGAAVGAGQGVSQPVSGSEKPTEEKSTRPATDPVPVKPGNIGGSSAIAAQAEASRSDSDRAVEKSPGKSSDDTDAAGLSEEERAQVKKLQARDREVRAHEAAHQAVGGQYTGAASFSFERGPDGRSYAVGGEVPIDTGAVPNDPEATIRKLRTVRRAALAPAEPSAQDRSIAVRAEAGVQQAQAEKFSDRRTEASEAADKREATEEASPASQPAGPAEAGETPPTISAQPAFAAEEPITREPRLDLKE